MTSSVAFNSRSSAVATSNGVSDPVIFSIHSTHSTRTEPPMTTPEITPGIAQKVLDVVDKGLCRGLGKPVPGKMCVEAAVCFAMGQPHGDEPDCVDYDLRSFKIDLNDSGGWKNDKARARGLRALAIAQLGTAGRFDFEDFTNRLKDRLLHKVLCRRVRQSDKRNKPLAGL